MIKIYSLNDPDTLEIKYIGKTVQKLEKRLSGHITKAKYNRTTHCSCWIYSLLLKNKRPIIQLIEECLEDVWVEREQYWIRYYKELICNHSIGGENGSLGYTCTVEHKNKISKSLIGRKRSIEECIAISNGSKGKILSDTTKEKLRNINIGKIQSLETKLKKSKYPILQINPVNNEVVAEYPTMGIAQQVTGFLKGNISSAINGRLKTYKGFKWKYKK